MTSKKLRIMVTQILYFFIVLLTGSTSLTGVRHHVGFTVGPSGAGDVVPRDERSRLWQG